MDQDRDAERDGGATTGGDVDAAFSLRRPSTSGFPAGKGAALDWLRHEFAAALPARLPPGLSLSRRAWLAAPATCVQRVQAELACERYAVRSDAADEDRPEATQAGRYLSLLSVAPAVLQLAIEDVFAALPGAAEDRVLLQPMLAPSRRAAVASTHRIRDGAPWYCIEFGHGDPAVVTAGRANGRHLAWPRAGMDARLRDVDDVDARAALKLLRAIEARIPGQPFELELLFTDAGLPWLLQLRALAACAHWPRPAPRSPRAPRAELFAAETGLLGGRTAFSLMSDWNPAELIGSHPRPLALSLFRDLISRDTWWRARAALGYRPPPRAGIDLLQPVLGRPYVDLRRSLNSLLPASLSPRIGARLVDAWVARVQAEPALHDKLEFEVCRSVRDFAGPPFAESVEGEALGPAARAEFEAALAGLTQRLMSIPPPSIQMPAQLPVNPSALLRLARACALRFAAQARLAFAAEAQLRSAQARGALSAARAVELRRSLGAASALRDQAQPAAWRASSFDITQPLLERAPAADGVAADPGNAEAVPFLLRPDEQGALALLLAEAGLAQSPVAWLHWLAASTRAREAGKYALMRPLAVLLEALALRGAACDLDRETLSWLPLPVLWDGLRRPRKAAELRARAARAQARAERERCWLLGPVLRGPQDLHAYDSLGLKPNFIGRRAVRAPLCVLPHGDPSQHVPPAAVVAVAQADPGYDWLFERGIAGLVTAWGGAHSHMAIRCAEFDLPAAIGCGEAVWQRLQSARSVHLDPLEEALWLE
jgi:hypothetical protein